MSYHPERRPSAPAGIPVADILSLGESPHRLPARFANELGMHGETGMGQTVFTVNFYSGLWRNYVSTGGFDFIDYPPLMSPTWVRSVQYGYRGRHVHDSPEAKVCFFAE